jgi:hypothetical protein
MPPPNLVYTENPYLGVRNGSAECRDTPVQVPPHCFADAPSDGTPLSPCVPLQSRHYVWIIRVGRAVLLPHPCLVTRAADGSGHFSVFRGGADSAVRLEQNPAVGLRALKIRGDSSPDFVGAEPDRTPRAPAPAGAMRWVRKHGPWPDECDGEADPPDFSDDDPSTTTRPCEPVVPARHPVGPPWPKGATQVLLPLSNLSLVPVSMPPESPWTCGAVLGRQLLKVARPRAFWHSALAFSGLWILHVKENERGAVTQLPSHRPRPRATRRGSGGSSRR